MSGYGQQGMMTEEERIAAALKKLNKGKFDAPGASNAGMKIAKRDPYSQAMLVDSMERAGATQFETPSVNSLMDAEKSRRSSQIDALIGPSNAAEIAAGERGVNSARKLAAAMRGKPLNQGKSVGPSGIYVGPNWGETIENLTNQLGSGYMDYQANKADAVLDPLRKADSETQRGLDAAVLQREIDNENRGISRDFRDEERINAEIEVNAANRKEDLERKDREIARAAAERLAELKIEQSENQLDRDGELELLMLEDQLKRSGFGLIEGASPEVNAYVRNLPSATERTTAYEFITTANALGTLIEDSAGLLESGKSWTGARDLAVNIAGGFFDGQAGQVATNLAQGAAYGDDELSFKGRIGNAVEAFKRARTGANLTGIEQILGATYDPSAQGITPEESVQRMKNLAQFIAEEFELKGVNIGNQFRYSDAPVKRRPTDEEIRNMSIEEFDEFLKMSGSE